MRPSRLIGLFSFAAVFVAAGPAAARSPQIAVAHEPAPASAPRSGFMIGFGTSPGAVVFSDGFAPFSRFDLQLGGGVSDRFTLGIDLSGTAYFGQKWASFGGDLIATGFIRRGFYTRFGAGAHSGLPSSAREFALVPAIGGLVGLGYEFPLAKRVGLALGADYDARVLTTGGFRQSVSIGLRLVGYVGKGKS